MFDAISGVLQSVEHWVGEEEGRRAVLIGADLTDASLRGTEVWRCNLKGCAIEPQALHTLLDCRTV